MDTQIRVDVDAVNETSSLITNTSSIKSSDKRGAFKKIICSLAILSIVAYLVYSQYKMHTVPRAVPTISAVVGDDNNEIVEPVEVKDIATVDSDETAPDEVSNEVAEIPNTSEDDVVEDVSTHGCYLGSCKVGYTHWNGRPAADYTSCLSVIDYVTDTLSSNWDSAKARVKSLYGINVQTCLKNKLTRVDKTISCTYSSYGCASSLLQCYGKCSSSLVWISERGFWQELPVMVGNTYDGFHSAPCVAAALTNYLSNFYCLRSDATAKKIGMGFADWFRDNYGGAALSQCPSGCDLS